MAHSPLFLSKRERRLWLCALAVVVAIYATLGLAPALAGELRERGLAEGAFALGMLLVGAAIVANGLNARPRGIEIAVIVGIAAAYLLMCARMALPEERTHLIEYGVVSLLVYEALSERARTGGAHIDLGAARAGGVNRGGAGAVGRGHPSAAAQPRL